MAQSNGGSTMTHAELRERWERRREDYGRTHATLDGVAVADEVLHDLDVLESAATEEVLTLQQAANLSGYSLDHLSRQIREGKLPNAGRKGVPRIRQGDLPSRPTRRLAEREKVLYDPTADARDLLSRRERRSYGNP